MHRTMTRKVLSAFSEPFFHLCYGWPTPVSLRRHSAEQNANCHD
jgi:hypothetical protein